MTSKADEPTKSTSDGATENSTDAIGGDGYPHTDRPALTLGRPLDSKVNPNPYDAFTVEEKPKRRR